MAQVTAELIQRMEKSLHEDPAIKKAKVIDIAGQDAPERDLVITVMLDSMAQQEGDSALRDARRTLVEKMGDSGVKDIVPRKWASCGELPVTPAGHVDEAALRRTLLGGEESQQQQQPPLETLEGNIMSAISETIQVRRSELMQARSFTQNGGDSFAAIQVFQRLLRENISLRVPDIMRAATLGELPSLVISRHGPSTSVAPSPGAHEAHEVNLSESPAVVSATTVTAS